MLTLNYEDTYIIATDRRFFHLNNADIFLISSYVVGTQAKKKNSCVSGSRLEKNRVGRSILLFFFFFLFFFFVTSGPTHQSAFCITD